MFITFEGVDGSGKTTQAGLLEEWLRGLGRDVVAVREPGATALGEQVRAVLLEGPDMTPWAEAALFTAARAELVEQVIRPALARGATVVCDRYIDSSIVYQGVARGLGAGAVAEFNELATRGLLPVQTFVLLLEPDTARARQTARPDRIERESGEFLEAVDRGYRELIAASPERYVALDATRSPAEIAEQVREQVRAR